MPLRNDPSDARKRFRDELLPSLEEQAGQLVSGAGVSWPFSTRCSWRPSCPGFPLQVGVEPADRAVSA